MQQQIINGKAKHNYDFDLKKKQITSNYVRDETNNLDVKSFIIKIHIWTIIITNQQVVNQGIVGSENYSFICLISFFVIFVFVCFFVLRADVHSSYKTSLVHSIVSHSEHTIEKNQQWLMMEQMFDLKEKIFPKFVRV